MTYPIGMDSAQLEICCCRHNLDPVLLAPSCCRVARVLFAAHVARALFVARVARSLFLARVARALFAVGVARALLLPVLLATSLGTCREPRCCCRG